jgi:D-alanyl-D-alanine carboxypeptidase (penicillin-binding protein 5/6)
MDTRVAFMTRKMTSLRSLAAGSALLFLFAPTLYAAEQAAPEAPPVDARAWILMDYASGKVLAEGNADETRPGKPDQNHDQLCGRPGVKAGKIKLDRYGHHRERCLGDRQPGAARLFGDVPEAGDQVSVSDLNKGVIIQSGNDASIALADYVAGSQDSFVSLMNGYAQKLG